MIAIREHFSCLFLKILSEQPRGDIESINRLLAQLSESPRQLDEQKMKELIRQPNFFLLAARAPNGNIVGIASLVIYETLTKSIGDIADVIVDEKHRSKGIGQRLIEELIGFAKVKKLNCIELTSRPEREAANRLYLKLGFQKRDTNCYRLTL